MEMMNKKTYVVGIGEVLWDLLPGGSKPGGAPANFAYHISQFGLDSMVVSAVGNDNYGADLVKFYDEIGLRHSLAIVDYPTGTVDVTLDAAGIPQYDITRNVAWDHIPYAPALSELAESATAVCFGSLAQRSPESRQTITRFIKAVAQSHSALIVFDGNLRQDFFDLATIEESLSLCNILKINDEELIIFCRLFGIAETDFMQQCRKLREMFGLKILIVTCGATGSYVITTETESYLPTPRVEVADTVGAGDSFTAAFVANILKGRPIAEAHAAAVRTSAYVCTRQGAMPQLPAEITLL